MRGTSRAALAQAREELARAMPGRTDRARLGDELFAVARVLNDESALRRTLGDASTAESARAELAGAVLRGKISDRALGLVTDVVRSRWSQPRDLVEAVEQLAVLAVVAAAEQAGRLDDLEDELFRFGRLVAATPDLRRALSNPFVAPEGKLELLRALLDGKVTPEAMQLISQAAMYPMGRSLDASLEDAARLAAEQRERLVAEVHVAVDLTGEQRGRLAAALAAAQGRQVQLNVVLDPQVIGGLSVRIGDEVIDGTVASRLAELRRRLAG